MEDFSKLPNEIYDRALKEIIKENLSDDNYEIKCSAGSKKGDNNLGMIYRINVMRKNEIKLKLILKTSPQNLARREQYLIHEIFGREIQFYKEVLPIFESFFDEKEIEIENNFAKCFKALKEHPFEGIFFEDLSDKGFTLHDRHKDITKNHVMLVLKALANLHGTFLCLKNQKSDFAEKFKNTEDFLIKIFKKENSSNLAWINEQKKDALRGLKYCKNQDLINRVHNVLNVDIVQQFEEALSGSDAEPFSVLCHGDVCFFIYFVFFKINCIQFQVLE